MERLNNKGFIATSVLYGITAIFIIAISIILANDLAARKNTNTLVESVKNDLNNLDN